MANTKQLTVRPVPEGFTRRSFAVFRLWAMLWSKVAIDRHLALSDHTADLDLRHIYILLNVHSRAAAVQKAWLEDIFQKRVVTDPSMKALLELHGEVDLWNLAAELGEFAAVIGARERQT